MAATGQIDESADAHEIRPEVARSNRRRQASSP